MLQSSPSKARIIKRNVLFLHYHSQIAPQRHCTLKGTEAYGYKSPLRKRKYLQRSYSRIPSAMAGAREKVATKFDENATAKPTSRLTPQPVANPGRNHILRSTPERALELAAFGNDTIYAVSTAPGRAGIAIVRITGPSSLDVRFLQSSKSSILTSAGLQ